MATGSRVERSLAGTDTKYLPDEPPCHLLAIGSHQKSRDSVPVEPILYRSMHLLPRL